MAASASTPQQRLQQTFLFQNTAPSLVAAVLQHPAGELCYYQAGQVIYSPSHYRRSLGFLLAGNASVYKLAGKTKLFMSHLAPGDLFGAAALFHCQPDYVTEIKALCPSQVFFLPQAALEQFFQQDFTLVQNYLAYLSGRILFLNQRLEDLARPTAADRVFHYLWEHSAQASFTPATSWTELAASLGLSRASLYRILDQLERQAAIQRLGKHIILLKETIEA